ncbi:MAG: SCO family protein [Pelistega sp.]|nr:SCO family protein [Pelistega sp.]
MMKRLALLIGFFLFSAGIAYAKLHGSDISGSTIGQRWEAVNAEAQPIEASAMQGKLRLYFFGFTQCPDVCPTTLLRLSEMYSLLDEREQAQLSIVLVSVDPERDTPEVIKRYLANFSERFEGLTGTPAQIQRLAQSFKVFYRKVPLGDTYTMEHSANLFLFDKKGNAKLFYYGDIAPENLASDIKTLLR